MAPAGWPAPLSRGIALDAGQITLRKTLEKMAQATGVRISYSAEHVPLDRVVCASFARAPLGDVLAQLLSDSHVRVVVAAADHIVLAAVAPAQAARATTAALQLPVYPLAPVIATADILDLTRTQPPGHALTVLDQTRIAQHATVGDALSSAGLWSWQSPTGFTAHYNARGASSFGASSPKIYIDGIEVANPLLAAELLPENVERIEIIRGPQGAALYGSDAVNGVTNIVTRHAAAGDGQPRLTVRSGVAISTSNFIDNAGLGQDHHVSARFGSASRSGAASLGAGRVGEFLPGSFARTLNADGSLRIVGTRTLVTGTARFHAKAAGNPAGLLLDSLFEANVLSMRQFTLGARVVFRQSDVVTHTAVIGFDGYDLDGFDGDTPGSQSVADSVLRAAGDEALRTTLRLSSVIRLRESAAARTTLTLNAEHSNLQQQGVLAPGVMTAEFAGVRSKRQASWLGADDVPPQTYDQNRASNGVSAQLDAGFFERFFVSAGARLQRDDVNGETVTSTLPMLSSSYVIGTPRANIRLRTAWGKAIRWPTLPAGSGLWESRVRQPVLAPEQQAGIETGIDVNLGATFGVQITHYDQTATGLLQTVAIDEGTRTRLQLQNVGEIGNTGWELQAFLQKGRLLLNTNAAVTRSTVLHVADGYTGDLRAGERMLAVPARTVGAQASWQADTWTASLGLKRAFDWINYDRRALAALPADVAGDELRRFWRAYDGGTFLRAGLTHQLNSRFTLLLSAENLLNHQTGEPDNATVLPGRTVSFGARAAF